MEMQTANATNSKDPEGFMNLTGANRSGIE